MNIIKELLSVNTVDFLRDQGLKVTPQRMAIYVMLSNTKSHPSAEDIYKQLLPTNPSISLATVYKTLDSFKSIGLVQELNVGNGKSNYDADMSNHIHIVCTCCGNIYDLNVDISTEFDQIKEKIANENSFLISHQQITLYSTCPDCQNS